MEHTRAANDDANLSLVDWCCYDVALKVARNEVVLVCIAGGRHEVQGVSLRELRFVDPQSRDSILMLSLSGSCLFGPCLFYHHGRCAHSILAGSRTLRRPVSW